MAPFTYIVNIPGSFQNGIPLTPNVLRYTIVPHVEGHTMARTSRNLERTSVFIPMEHKKIIHRLAERKGVTPSDIIRAMLRKYLREELEKIQGVARDS